ncbi:MAG: T9SS C-terminal target domain-containing protein [Bacteroidetes bacterium]|nr:MAG: T9SS C-terminal target domain-containing protein [Bacteroidota bacterium]
MKNLSKIIKAGLGVSILILAGAFFLDEPMSKKEEEKEPYVFKKRPKQERIAGRYQQEFLMTRDPKTNTVPTERLIEAKAISDEKLALKSAESFPVYWEERGPDNVGGRTRGLIFDANDPTQKTVWAGSVAGGLWKTTNIDASPPGWTKINDLFENMAITSIVQDPSDPDIIYFGTGEGYWNQDAVAGLGIWQSLDGGDTWDVLPFTLGNSNFAWVNKVLVAANGDIYAATSTGGVQFSDDGGTSFSKILGNGIDGCITDRADDIEIASNGDIYAGMRNDGIFKRASGASNFGKQTTGLPTSGYGRVEITSAPSDAQTVYVAFADTTSANSGGCLGVFQSTNGGTNWNTKTVPGSIGTQCWYDFIMAVDPNDDSRVWLGGVRLFVSDNDGDDWTQANYDHVDHHAIVYRPGDSDEMILGNDGGVERSTNGSAGTPSFTPKNDGYNVTQFYSVAMHPTSGSNEMLGGTQDNATPVFSASGIGSTTCVLCCCDGGWAHIDQDDPSIQIASTQDGSFNLSTGGSGGAFNNIVPADADARFFITPSDYDSDANMFYFSDAVDTFGRVSDIGGTNVLTFQPVPAFNNARVSAFEMSSATDDRVFMGLSNGMIFQIDDADMPGGITATNLNAPAVGFTSSIDVEPGNDMHIIITYSNYGVQSIWETTDGGTIWRNVEGNIPDMPIRWVMFHPFDPEQALVATELGVWTCADLTVTNPDWQPTNGFGLANVRVDMLAYRSSDHTIAAATHGRGMYTTDYFGMLANCQPNLNLSGVIAPGIYTAEEVLTTDGTVQGATAVILQAGEMVVLEPDFTAERGSDFWALILPCAPPGSFAPDEGQYYLKMPDESGETAEEIEDEEEITKEPVSRIKCYPNPAQTFATVEFELEQATDIRIVVMNARGQMVDVLADGFFHEGVQKFPWDTNALESGLYFVQAQMASHAVTEKVFVVK